MKDGKYFWLVKANYYHKINQLLNANWTEIDVIFFKKRCPIAMYVSISVNNNKTKYTGYMPYPVYERYDKKSYSFEYMEKEAIYMGELSIKTERKLKINNIMNSWPHH